MTLLGLFDSVNARRASGEAKAEAEACELCRVFSRNLQAAREAAGLTRAELAKASGVSRRHIWLIETTDFNVTLATIEALARHVRKAPLDLLTSATPRKARTSTKPDPRS